MPQHTHTHTHRANSRNAAASLAAFKAKFDTAAVGVRWVATNGLRVFLQFWFSRRPMFWLPKGLAPGYVEWFLAFPRAPTGSVSIQLWGIACAASIQLVSEVVVAVVAVVKGKAPGQAQGQQPQAFEMKAQTARGDGKKEL